jgi:hypothetical protein
MQPNSTKGKERKGKEKKGNIYIEEKRKFLDFVFLTENEYTHLVENFGDSNVKKYIDRLNGYI